MFRIGRKSECHRAQDRLSEYIDNLLSNEEKDLLESHLETCDACSKEIETLRMTVRLLNQVPTVPAPRSFVLRESEDGRERVSEPRTWGRLRPVPVFAVSGVYGVRTTIFDPQRMRWLRPATAVVAAALVLLLMLDFLQVVPHGGGIDNRGLYNELPSPTVMAPSIGEEQDVVKLEDGEPVEPPQIPAPLESPLATQDDAGSRFLIGAHEGVEIADGTEGGWPMRQLEIAIGAIFVALVGAMLLTARQRNKWSRV